MEVFRFMSLKEFKNLIKGKDLINKTKHSGRTNSQGFCFMKTIDNSPEEAFEFLSGVVSDEVCVIFNTRKRLKKTWGVYADPYGMFFDTITEDEYCTDKYNNKDFEIVKCAIPDMFKEWSWYTNTEVFLKEVNKIKRKQVKKEKECKAIQNAEKELRENKAEEFVDFIKEIRKGIEMEIKINDKYYKFPCRWKETEFNPFNNMKKVSFEIYM